MTSSTPHPSGLPGTDASRACRACAWSTPTADGLRCHAAAAEGAAAVPIPDGPACGCFEPDPGCEDCGACCREAFDSVPVERDDEPILTAHPELVRVAADGWRDLERVPQPSGGTRCAALVGAPGTFSCVVYAHRPTPCRDLAIGSPNCLFARRRVGLSPDLRPGEGAER